MKTTIRYYIGSIVLFFVGFILHDNFLAAINYLINNDLVQLSYNNLSEPFYTKMSFALILGAVPVLLKIANSIAKFTKKQLIITIVY
ncbi:hypothetical protein NBRC110019_15810 [Neptunitalea chrysea]|uniref:Uncharacterized protein n=1 Tax=Neptunitalea chrysea TaxID=1647581 RepID=A0A9W6B4S8_9FLAO|nr:hypothetical protein [Neptunitalea chrysea]GLB52541.1 hypothetical protein NBRC110019_15810 [Neptunitalea chrysea]